MPALLAIIASILFSGFGLWNNVSAEQPNTVSTMYDRSEEKLCGRKPAPLFKGCSYVCECSKATSCRYQLACWK